MSDFNAKIIEEFRAHDGKVGGPFEGAPMVLLTTVGAKSGAAAHDAAGVPARRRPCGDLRLDGRRADEPGVVPQPRRQPERHRRGRRRALRGDGQRDHRRLSTADAVVRQADGKIIRVPGNGTVYINLGNGDQIAKGLTFEVYDRIEGIPSIGDPTSDENLPRGKASIEVIRVAPAAANAASSISSPARTSSKAI